MIGNYMVAPHLERKTVRPKVIAGKPCIRGIRITVGMIMGLLSVGKTHEEILELYPDLEKQDTFSALEYVTRKVSGNFY